MKTVQYFLLVPVMCVLLAYDAYSFSARRSASSEMMPVQTGLASWYGREEQGGPTASGERFDRHQLTAAHRHLPFNTVVRVTNEKNGRSVMVRINDRGPYRGHRILDLSEAAAERLDMKRSGVVPVKIEVLPASGADSLAPTSP